MELYSVVSAINYVQSRGLNPGALMGTFELCRKPDKHAKGNRAMLDLTILFGDVVYKFSILVPLSCFIYTT